MIASDPIRELLAANAALREDFASFIRMVFLTLNPEVPYLSNWHILAIAYELEKVRRGETRRLIIAMPPRSLRSISASIAFPAFIHGHEPFRHIVCASYGQDLSVKMQNDYRRILAADWYKSLFPQTRVGTIKDTEDEIALTRHGTRLATSIGGAVTGRGADFIIVDDPLKASEAMGPRRAVVNAWFGATLLPRLNEKKTGAIVIVTQRLHVDDLVGHVVETSGDAWKVLTLPAIAPADASIPIREDRSGRIRFYNRKAGDVLHQAREPRETLEEIEREQGSEAFAAQYLQTPAPAGGLMFHREWFQYYDELPVRDRDTEIYQSWDTASKIGAPHDFSVCTTWQIAKGRYYLLDLIRGKYEFPDLKAKAIEAHRLWRPTRVLVEDTGVGTSLIHELREARIDAIAVNATQGKEHRASGQTAKFEAKRVWFPKSAPWLPALMTELLAFPGGHHDDQVDSIVQMLGYRIQPVIIKSIRF